MEKIGISKEDFKIALGIYEKITEKIAGQYKSGESFKSCFSIKKIDKENDEYLKKVDEIQNEELKETMKKFLDDYVIDVKRCLEGLKIFNSAHKKLKKYDHFEYYNETFEDKFNFKEHYRTL